MRITVSIPENVYRASTTLARRLGLSRSMLYGRALEEYVDHHQGDIAVHPLIRIHVEPVLVEEVSRLPDEPALADAIPSSRPTNPASADRTR